MEIEHKEEVTFQLTKLNYKRKKRVQVVKRSIQQNQVEWEYL